MAKNQSLRNLESFLTILRLVALYKMEFITSTKGSVKICYNGYTYAKNKILTSGNSYWECSERRSGNGCKAKLRLDPANEILDAANEDSHEPDPEHITIIKARAGMKRAAKDTDASTNNILTRNLQGFSQAELVRFPNIETMRRDIKRTRIQNDLVTQDDNDKLFEIPEEVKRNELGEEFLMYDNGNENRLLIFGTQESLRCLANSDHWFMDGTFKVSPPQFKQLYTIHALSNGRNIVGAYALLPNKQRETYEEFLIEMQRLINDADPQSIMLDFETSMLSVIDNIYDNTRKVGCLFHLTKNIYRHVQILGLQETYVNDQEFQSNIRMISALSFVPVEDTRDAFDTLADHCGEVEQPVLDYFKTYYIGELRRGRYRDPMFPHSLWNMHTRVQHNLPRTNNNLEGWHNRFAGMFKESHPSIWKFIEVLKQESSHNHLIMAQLIAGAPPPAQKRIYQEVSTRLRNLVDGYDIDNVIDFLRGVSYNLARH